MEIFTVQSSSTCCGMCPSCVLDCVSVCVFVLRGANKLSWPSDRSSAPGDSRSHHDRSRAALAAVALAAVDHTHRIGERRSRPCARFRCPYKAACVLVYSSHGQSCSHAPPPGARLSLTAGAKAEAWCLLIHADASLSLSLSARPSPAHTHITSQQRQSLSRARNQGGVVPLCRRSQQGSVLLRGIQAQVENEINN